MQGPCCHGGVHRETTNTSFTAPHHSLPKEDAGVAVCCHPAGVGVVVEAREPRGQRWRAVLMEVKEQGLEGVGAGGQELVGEVEEAWPMRGSSGGGDGSR